MPLSKAITGLINYKKMKHVLLRRFQKVKIESFTRAELDRMLTAYAYSREMDTAYLRQIVMRRTTANRNQAIISALLDLSVRVSDIQLPEFM